MFNHHIGISRKGDIGREKEIIVIITYSEHRLLQEREILTFLTMR